MTAPTSPQRHLLRKVDELLFYRYSLTLGVPHFEGESR